MTQEKENNVLIRDKFLLTLKEATQYFGIGEKKLRQMAEEYNTSNCFLHNGVKLMIKREKFEQFLDELTTI